MSETTNTENSTPWVVIFVILVAIFAGVGYWFLSQDKEQHEPVETPEEITVTPQPEVMPEPPVEKVSPTTLPEMPDIMDVPEPELEPVESQSPLPRLDESDDYLKASLPDLTWRKELLKLVITDDLIRRVVVFTDNFAQGVLAYEHAPFVQPNVKFSAKEQLDQNGVSTGQWQWDESAARRFALYVDLLRSIDSESLVELYIEVKPLVNEAYAELGYADQDFTEVLQDAIIKVLDMELPEQDMTLVRPSVMYQFENEALESLPESDKLLLRIGRENLLVLKSVLLEFSDKLAKAEEK
ncbi:DUF3014 domain-containing protein [Thalassotalea sp. LPB0316]|uniref:DUF3014 domain-containing protein n=1 Tax=Thalassotalea sp. LPB0316 TaxID=2769490 RepID=UPI001868DF06|nr:DUF3014 domain-containing protein [Thalassotalea sp. LPB0316]QOL27149.1 DUF3014 domain-containing protein [Thalassotalea sp. LPB0316]